MSSRHLRAALAACLLLLAGSVAAAPAPEFTLPDTSGKAIHLDTFKGKVVYLDFWASWCTPCRHSFPWMNAMASRYGKDGLVVVAVNLDKDHSLSQRFINATHPNFTVLYDPDGKVAERYGVAVMPSSYLIGRDGELLGRHQGFREDETYALESKINTALAQH